MLWRVLASGRPSRRALKGAPSAKVKNKILDTSRIGEQTFVRSGRARRWATQDEVNSYTTQTLTACETNSALILRRPPTEVGLARLRQGESVEIGNSRFRWAAISKDGRLRRLLTLAGLAALLHMSSPARAAESDLIEEGRDLYADTCAACHGRDMVNAGGIAFDLRRFPKDDFARFRNSVLNGKGEAMPAWRDKIDDSDLAALWAYVRSGR